MDLRGLLAGASAASGPEDADGGRACGSGGVRRLRRASTVAESALAKAVGLCGTGGGGGDTASARHSSIDTWATRHARKAYG